MLAIKKSILRQVVPAVQRTVSANGMTMGSTRALIVNNAFRKYPVRSRLQAGGPYASRKKPTIAEARTMALSPTDMDNDTLVTLGALGNHFARKEIVKRHVMAVDNIPYDEACKVYDKIKNKNKEGKLLLSLPYQIGITTGLLAAAAAVPMVFDLGTVEWFNHHYVTTDVPEPRDLETALEVGSWAWNWMEPPLGTISFALLSLQFSRAQFVNMGIKPYTEKIKRMRGERLANAFPQYDRSVLIAFSESANIYK